MSILVIAENDNVSLKASTLNTITAAKAISPDIDVLVCGQGCEMPAKAAAEVAGVRKVYCADCEQLVQKGEVCRRQVHLVELVGIDLLQLLISSNHALNITVILQKLHCA